jgi:hypothetical protein
MWVIGLFSWSLPVVGMVFGSWLSLGWYSCTSRARTGKDFQTTACFVVSVCVFVYCLCSLYNFYLFKSVYEFLDIIGLFYGLFCPDQLSYI